MSFVLFVIFSLIEAVALFYLCCVLFRYKVSTYLIKYIIVQLLITTGNYLIRQEETFSGLAPLFSMIMFILFLQIFLDELSLFWAAIMGIVSFTIMAVIQGLILLIVLNVTNFTSLAELQSNTIDSYIIQFITAIMIIVPSRYLYKKGIGFTFNLDSFKLAGENIIMLIILLVSLIAIGVLFLINDIMLITLVLILPPIYLVYFAIKKQKKDVSNSSFPE